MSQFQLDPVDAQSLLRLVSQKIPALAALSLGPSGFIYETKGLKIQATELVLQTTGIAEFSGIKLSVKSLSIQSDGALSSDFTLL